VAAGLRDCLTALRQTAFQQIRDGYADSGEAPGKDKEELTTWRKKKAVR